MRNSLINVYWDSNLPIYKISHTKLLNEGIKCLLIDVDGTLLSRGSINIPLQVKEWINESKNFFNLYLVSNNPSKKRISKIGEELKVNYKYRAHKPSKKITLEVIKKLNEDNKNIAIIGDRIFTDILVGNRCKIKTILVKRIGKNGIPLKFNLTLLIERIFSLIL